MTEVPDTVAKVVSLRGTPLPTPGEPEPGVVRLAEKLAEMARSGEIVGLGAVVVHSDEGTSNFHEGVSTMGQLGSLEMLRDRILDRFR